MSPTDRILFSIFYSSSWNDSSCLHSFPTRRSSDLQTHGDRIESHAPTLTRQMPVEDGQFLTGRETQGLKLPIDRKSTRLNSSHGYISYAVFCLKKKTATASGSGTLR